ncbi:MAG TPA: hypothetical protein VFG69_12725 [Nannocystaceae bacterium]|nr:hypothetical protein [Nannocystaceae bacterium]
MIKCGHASRHVLTEQNLGVLLAACAGREYLACSIFAGIEGVAVSGPDAGDRCAHVVHVVHAPVGIAADRSDWWSELVTEVFQWDVHRNVNVYQQVWHLETFRPCTTCATAGCAACHGLGWTRKGMCDEPFGACGRELPGGHSSRSPDLRNALPRHFRPLATALASTSSRLG